MGHGCSGIRNSLLALLSSLPQRLVVAAVSPRSTQAIASAGRPLALQSRAMFSPSFGLGRTLSHREMYARTARRAT